MNELHIAPNRPLTVSLLDPEGHFDFETGMGQYQTTTGELVTLPRPAVVILNTLDPQPGEQIVICKHWSGRPGEKAEWTISLSPKSENTRAEAEKAPSDLTGQLERSIEAIQERKRVTEPPTPIRRPSKRAPSPEVQPRLFDKERRADPDNLILLCDTCHDWTHSRQNIGKLFLGRGHA